MKVRANNTGSVLFHLMFTYLKSRQKSPESDPLESTYAKDEDCMGAFLNEMGRFT